MTTGRPVPDEFRRRAPPGVQAMGLETVLLIVLVLILIGALPTWPHSRGWGYYPSGGLGVLIIVVLVLLLI
jgi:hypothetical protein